LVLRLFLEGRLRSLLLSLAFLITRLTLIHKIIGSFCSFGSVYKVIHFWLSFECSHISGDHLLGHTEQHCLRVGVFDLDSEGLGEVGAVDGDTAIYFFFEYV
jgi:hypothetical protein